MPDYLSIALGAGDTTVLKLTNAYRDPRQPGPVGEADADRLCPGPQRQGHLPRRQPLPGDGATGCNARRLGRQGRCRGRRRGPGRCSTRMAAYQMVHILEGVVERGTATVLRDLDRPMFGKTGTTSGPTNVWFVGGTPEIVAGVYHGLRPAAADGRLRPGRHARRADLQAIRPGRVQGHAEGAVRRAAGHPHGRGSTARSGQARVRQLPDRRRPQVVGDLGGVPARDRAAPLVPARRAWRAAAAARTCAAQRDARRGRPAQRATATSCKGRAGSTRPARTGVPAKAGTQPTKRGRQPSPEISHWKSDHARRSASPYRPDQCRDRAAAPVPRLGPGAEAARRAQRARSRTRPCGTIPRRRRR